MGIMEDKNTTIAKFLSGLSLEIKDRVELLPYKDLNDLVRITNFEKIFKQERKIST